MINASLEQKHDLLKEIGESMLNILNSQDFQDNENIWLSTHGLGIPWLHIRIDTIPKYYSYKNYKIPVNFI